MISWRASTLLIAVAKACFCQKPHISMLRCLLAQQEEDEEDFQKRNPDVWEAFSDLVPDDDGPPDPVDPSGKHKGKDGKGAAGQSAKEKGKGTKEGGEEGEAAMASEAQAKSAAAKQLLEGQLLAELVGSHMAVMSTAAAAIAPAAASAAPQALPRSAEVWLSPGSLVESFRLSYDLGAQLLGWLGGALDGGLDAAALTGHLMRACMECHTLGRAPAATAADAALGGGGGKAGGARGRKAASAGASASTWLASGAILSLDNAGDAALTSGADAPNPGADALTPGSGVDINGPCVEEVCLLQAPIAAMAERLRALLAEFPEHPVLLSLAAICARCLALPVTCTLKTALTGLELLLNRAQVSNATTHCLWSVFRRCFALVFRCAEQHSGDLDCTKALTPHCMDVCARHAV